MLDPAANVTTRLLKSVTYTVPAPSTANPCGWYSPLNGNTVVPVDPVANLTTRPYMPSLVTYTLPALSTATPLGERRKSMPVNGNTVCPDACVGDHEGRKTR
ncbi:Uncharacterised protein [Mycobacterium tuberculosis]|nr:Uncharacterised protein [Mycobacterium tuberculosis]